MDVELTSVRDHEECIEFTAIIRTHREFKEFALLMDKYRDMKRFLLYLDAEYYPRCPKKEGDA